MRKIVWVCRTWVKIAGEGWKSEFSHFNNYLEAVSFGDMFLNHINLGEIDRDYEVYSKVVES